MSQASHLIAAALVVAACSGTTAPFAPPPLPEGNWLLVAAEPGRVAVAGIGADERPAVLAAAGGEWEPLPLPPFTDGAIPTDLAATDGTLTMLLASAATRVWQLPAGAAEWTEAAVVGPPDGATGRSLAAIPDGWLVGGRSGAAAGLWTASESFDRWQAEAGPPGPLGAGQVTGASRRQGVTVLTAVDDEGAFAARSEGDGWERIPLSDDPFAQVLGLAGHDGGFLAIGTDRGAAGAQVWSSDDGRAWRAVSIPEAFAFTDVAVTADGYLALALNRDFVSELWSSPDGVEWERLP